jgi:hypothetical protein
VRHEFVEHVPEHLEDGVVYVSISFATAVHKCACGCGQEVVTPLSPTDWTLAFDGESISLDPSIGNWSFPCQSHYWIRNDRVKWAPKWSDEEIEGGRARDRSNKALFYKAGGAAAKPGTPPNDVRDAPDSEPMNSVAASDASTGTTTREGLWMRIRRWLGRSA